MKYTLAINLGMKARNDLKVLLSMSEFSILSNLDIFIATLLLCLSNFNPFFHCKMLADLSKFILAEPKAIKKRTVADWIQKNVVVWSVIVNDIGQCLFPKLWIQYSLTEQSIEHPDDQHELGLPGECGPGGYWI